MIRKPQSRKGRQAREKQIVQQSIQSKYLLLIGSFIVVFFILAEVVAGFVYNSLAFPNSYDTTRNPNYQRGWVEYTQPPAVDADARRVIVISNSQGFLKERAEGNLTYAAELETLLNQQLAGQHVEVLNWSIHGGMAPEMVLLAARSAAHNPDVIVLVTYMPNFVADIQPISWYVSDANRLAYLPEVRQYLPERFVARHKINRPLAWLEANTNLGRMKNFLEIPRMGNWTWTPIEPVRVVEPRGTPIRWNDNATDLMQDFYDTVRAASPDAQLLIVSMPMNQTGYDDEGWGILHSFIPHTREALGDSADVRSFSMRPESSRPNISIATAIYAPKAIAYSLNGSPAMYTMHLRQTHEQRAILHRKI